MRNLIIIDRSGKGLYATDLGEVEKIKDQKEIKDQGSKKQALQDTLKP